MSTRFQILGPIQHFLALHPGAAVSDVAEALQLSSQQAAQSLYRAAKVGHVFVLKGDRHLYYATEAERDEAAKSDTPAAPPGAPKGANTALIFAAIQAYDGKPGATHPHLVKATGLTARQVSKGLASLVATKRLFSAAHKGVRHYFVSVEARDAGAAAFREAEDRAIAERREKRRQSPAARPLKLGVNAPVQIGSAPRKAWANAPVVVPGDVKVTVCPGYVPRTFEPPPEFKGAFTREWERRRQGAEA
jgi:hypothetical protein